MAANFHLGIRQSVSYVSVTRNQKGPDDTAATLHYFSDGFPLIEVKTASRVRPVFKDLPAA